MGLQSKVDTVFITIEVTRFGDECTHTSRWEQMSTAGEWKKDLMEGATAITDKLEPLGAGD